jgi:hypothetical protein
MLEFGAFSLVPTGSWFKFGVKVKCRETLAT